MNKLLRRSTTLAAMLLAAAAILAPQPLTETRRIPQFENDDVRVWKSIVMPNSPLTMHRHEHARVIITLAGGVMNIVQESGASQANNWETGKAYWLTADAGKGLHADVNAGKKPIEVMVVELKHEK